MCNSNVGVDGPCATSNPCGGQWCCKCSFGWCWLCHAFWWDSQGKLSNWGINFRTPDYFLKYELFIFYRLPPIITYCLFYIYIYIIPICNCELQSVKIMHSICVEAESAIHLKKYREELRQVCNTFNRTISAIWNFSVQRLTFVFHIFLDHPCPNQNNGNMCGCFCWCICGM